MVSPDLGDSTLNSFELSGQCLFRNYPTPATKQKDP